MRPLITALLLWALPLLAAACEDSLHKIDGRARAAHDLGDDGAAHPATDHGLASEAGEDDGGNGDGPAVPDGAAGEDLTADQARHDLPRSDVHKPDLHKTDLHKPDLGKPDLHKPDLGKPDLPPVTGGLVLNEVDYDQPGTDTGEFIELYNGSGGPVSLATVAVVVVNGGVTPAAEYSRFSLASAGTLPAGGYLVLASPTVTVPAGVKSIPLPAASNNLQNGPADGLALINTATGAVLDVLSYGGPVTGASVSGLGKPLSLVKGTALAASVVDSNSVDASLCRKPSGKDTGSSAADWKLCVTPSPGKANP